MATQKESGKKMLPDSSVEDRTADSVDPVDVAIAKLGAAQERLDVARRSERTARGSGDPEQIDSAVYERLNAEKAYRDATRAEAQARAARAAARRGAGAGPDGPKARGF